MSKVNTIDCFMETFLSLCSKKEFTKISMREVARETTYSHTLLLKYFPTKNELLVSSYTYIMKKHTNSYEAANSLGELACALIETWEDRYQIASNFSIAFADHTPLRFSIYKISRKILLKPILKLCNGDKNMVESTYTALMSLVYYPATLIKNQEVNTDIQDYKNLLLQLDLKPHTNKQFEQ